MLVHITLPEPSHVSSSQNEGGAQQNLGLILSQKKDFWVVRFPRLRHFPHFPLSPFHWKHMETCFLSPFPPFTESTWKHAFSKDLLYGFVNIFLTAGKWRLVIAANVFSVFCAQFGDYSEIVRRVIILFVKEGATQECRGCPCRDVLYFWRRVSVSSVRG